jgi:flagellar motility protein MotE (MotC chaperone)
MSAGSSHQREDRILLSRKRVAKPPLPSGKRSYLWTIVGGLLSSIILFWLMVQLGQAAPASKGKQPLPIPMASPAVQAAKQQAEEPVDDGIPVTLLPKAGQGPALDAPREVIDMLEFRKRYLDRREESIKQEEQRLQMVKAEMEQLLARNEAVEKKILAALVKEEQQGNDEKTQQAKAKAERERQALQQKAQLAKMYEAMPSEEAAARLERISDKKAIEILRLVKTKTAGSILAQVKVDRAAKLTEQLMTQAQ